jgi:hypothetical protein
MAKKSDKAGSSPSPKQPVDGNGLPIHTFNVPGVSRKAGTPGWVSGPAKTAARKAK